MMSRSLARRLSLGLGIAAGLFLMSMAAEAQRLDRLLNGTYHGALRRTCVSSEVNAFEPLAADGSARTASAEVDYTYNGDGTGVVVGKILIISEDSDLPGDFPLRESRFRCTVRYSVNGDRSFTQRLVRCDSTVISGVVAGETAVTTGIRHRGQIARDGQTVLLVDTDQNVETTTPASFPVTYAICNRAATLLRTR